MNRSKVLRVVAGLALATALVLPVFFMPVAVQAATATVTADNFEFSPNYRTVHVGDSVTWTNPTNCQNCANHTVTFNNGPAFDSQINPGDTATRTFSSTGKYYYYCRYHGSPGSGMAGTIEVTTGSTSSPTGTATGTVTHTVTLPPTSTRTPRPRTASPSHTATTSPSPSASPSPSPSASSFSPTPTPTETPTQPSESGSPIAAPSSNSVNSSSNGNTQALIAIIGVLVLGLLGFLIYRRTITRP